MGPGIDSTSLCSLLGRYDNHIPTRLLAPIDCSEIQALFNIQKIRKEDNMNKAWCKGCRYPFERETETEPVFLNVYGAWIWFQGWIPPAYVAWRAGTTTLFLLGS